MNWITYRAPTEKDGDQDGNVAVQRFGSQRGGPGGYLKGAFWLKPWHEVDQGTPFIPWEEPYPNSSSENEKPSDRSRSKTFGGQGPGTSWSVTVQLWDAAESDDHK